MKDIEQTPDGKSFALPYYDNGRFLVKLFMRDDPTGPTTMHSSLLRNNKRMALQARYTIKTLDINKLFGINANTMVVN